MRVVLRHELVGALRLRGGFGGDADDGMPDFRSTLLGFRVVRAARGA